MYRHSLEAQSYSHISFAAGSEGDPAGRASGAKDDGLDDDAAYYLARAAAELAMAKAARHPKARMIHLDLAAAYRGRVHPRTSGAAAAWHRSEFG